jgi:hypothetical protein
MWRLLFLAAFVCLVGGLPCHRNAASVPTPNPDDGTVKDGIVTSQYFPSILPLAAGYAVRRDKLS